MIAEFLNAKSAKSFSKLIENIFKARKDVKLNENFKAESEI